ncbi:MAG: sulfite exporter TauE/SafE family protein, partial [Thaumarchaeota archaeon]
MVDVITVLLLSILAGLLGSLVGLGGSLITTPALVALGVPVKYAIAAGMVTIIATSSGSASSYVREKIV